MEANVVSTQRALVPITILHRCEAVKCHAEKVCALPGDHCEGDLHLAIIIAAKQMPCAVTAYLLEKRGPVSVSCLTYTVKWMPCPCPAIIV